MKRLCLGLIALVLASCSSVKQTPPPLTPLRPVPTPLTCAEFFPQGDWQYVHALRFQLTSGGGGGSAIGVVVLTSQDIRCALTTVEGLTLFEARAKGTGPVEIIRALPPFDRQYFADNLVKDIRTLFLPPLAWCVRANWPTRPGFAAMKPRMAKLPISWKPRMAAGACKPTTPTR